MHFQLDAMDLRVRCPMRSWGRKAKAFLGIVAYCKSGYSGIKIVPDLLDCRMSFRETQVASAAFGKGRK
jgi:hypothetical protein